MEQRPQGKQQQNQPAYVRKQATQPAPLAQSFQSVPWANRVTTFMPIGIVIIVPALIAMIGIGVATSRASSTVHQIQPAMTVTVDQSKANLEAQPTATPLPVDTATPVPTDTPEPTATPQPVPTATPRPPAPPSPPPTPCPGVNCNPWGYNFTPGNLIYSPDRNLFCNYFNCIPSFWKYTNGYVEECSDGTYSHSGGVSGSCSSHGGNWRPLYSH